MDSHQNHTRDDWLHAPPVIPPQRPERADDENLPEVLTADNAGAWQNEKYVDLTNRVDDTAKYLAPVYYPEAVSPMTPMTPAPGYDKPLPPIQQKPTATVRRRTMWIAVGIALAIAAIIAGVVGGVVGSKNARASSHESSAGSSAGSSSASTTPAVIATASLTPTTTLATVTLSTTSSSAAATSTGVCVEGTVASGETQNYLGLCKFCCGYGYCPPGPCTCTSYGSEDDITPLPETNTTGCPLEGESDGYLGLCSYACNHGYCPETACTNSTSVCSS